ncbi:Plasma membrane-associated cation-binding protein 1 [Dionaea muscipula]
MGYWKSKVLPKIQKVFGKDPAKKAAALEALKSFDESKEVINKEFEEKQGDLQPKVIEIYEASSAEIKSLIKEPKEAGIKKQPVMVQKFLEELAKIEFPGSQVVSEACSKVGPALLTGPVIFIFEKVSTFIPTTEETVDAPPPVTTEREGVVEEEHIKEAEVAVVEAEKAKSSAEAAPPPPAAVEPPKVEPAETPVVVETPPKPVEVPPTHVVEPAAEEPKS